MFALVAVLVALVAVGLWSLGGYGPLIAIVWAWLAGSSVVRLKRFMDGGGSTPDGREDEPFHSGRIEVDDEVFDVSVNDALPGQQDLRWLTGPDPDYGFSIRTSDGALVTRGALVSQIRDFLANVDRGTGHLE